MLYLDSTVSSCVTHIEVFNMLSAAACSAAVVRAAPSLVLLLLALLVVLRPVGCCGARK